jgi:hypothetical protein
MGGENRERKKKEWKERKKRGKKKNEKKKKKKNQRTNQANEMDTENRGCETVCNEKKGKYRMILFLKIK